MASEPRPERLAAWRLFLNVHARVTEVLARELEAERQLPLGWYDVLVQLSEVPGGRLRMNELARAVLLSRAGLTRLVDRMVLADLVQREPCEDDRRGTNVVMTPEGRAALRGASPTHLRGVDEHFTSHLTDGEAAAMRAAFERILAEMERRPG